MDVIELCKKWVTKKENFFFLVYTLYEVEYFFFGASQLSRQYNFHKLTFIGSAIIVVCLVAIILTTKYTQIEWGVIGVMVLLSVYAYYLGNDNVLLIATLMIPAAKNIDFNVFVRRDIWLRVILFMAVVALNLIGVINTVTAARQGDTSGVRNALGFTQFNIAGALAMSIMLEWLYLRFNRLNLIDYLGVAAIIIALLKFTNSRGAMLATIFMLFAVPIATKFGRNLLKIKLVKYSIEWSFSIFAVISFFAVAFYTPKNLILGKINQLLSERLNVLHQYFNGYKLHLLPIKVGAYRQSSIIIMDNTYMMIAIEFGIIILLAFCYLYWRRMMLAVKQNEIAMLCLLLAIVVFGITESAIYVVGINFTLLSLFSQSKDRQMNNVLLS